MYRTILAVLGGAMLLALGPSAAIAAPQQVPPGNSELDQYVPTVPDSEGDNQLGAGGGDSGGGLPPSVVSDLRAAGPDGEAAAAVLDQSAPRSGGSASTESGQGDGADGGTAGSAGDDESVPGAILEGLSSSSDGGVGILLPIFLGVVAGVGAFLVLRRRWPAQG
jgi:hypothetical protein